MNERIRRLAVEAFFDEATDVSTDKMYHFGEEKMQKFAELIILDAKCWIHKRIGPKTALDFLEHFGVEE